MKLGEQIHAPGGFHELVKGETYHFLRSNPRRVTLLTFGAPAPEQDSPPADSEVATPPKGKKDYQPRLVFLQRKAFEDAVLEEQIKPCEIQQELPPWHGDMTSKELRSHSRLELTLSRPHDTRMDMLLAHVWPAVSRIAEILDSDDPVRLLNCIAREANPVQNETRFRRNFFAYIAFGMNRLALHYPIFNIGKWSRLGRTTKFGRPSIAFGALHGHSACSTEIRELCLQGYRAYAGPGVHMGEIYRKTIKELFHCIPTRDNAGRAYFMHPEGAAFPSERQFGYYISLDVDLATRQQIKYGQARTRNRIRPSQGKFSDRVGNLMEVVEADAYVLKEVPKGYEEGSHLPRLVVVRIRCMTSGLLTGIGFSIGGETAEAYRMAKACQAVDKVWFCWLFGIEIEAWEWPSQGLSMHEITDRGAGATSSADAAIAELRPMIKELTPTYAPRSKAGIETSNPKAVEQEGQPEYVVSNMTYPQLAAREITRLLKDNHTINVQSRLNANLLAAGVLPTPTAVWSALDKVGRNHSYQVSQEEAIRGFFARTDLTYEDGALYLHGFRFWSKEFRDSGLPESLSKADTNKASCYMLNVCVRHLFVDGPDGMVTIDAMHGIRDGDETLYFSAPELEQLARLRARGQSTLRIHKQAASANFEGRFEETFGIPFDQGQRRTGRPKRHSQASSDEVKQIAPLLKARGGRR